MDTKKILLIAVIVLAVVSAYFALDYPPRVSFEDLTALAIAGEGEKCDYRLDNGPTCAVGYHCVRSQKNRLPFRGDIGGICVRGSTGDSGIKGMVYLGPTCPVMRNPPDQRCAEKPWETTLDAISASNSVAKKFYSKADGTFTVSLPAGDYVIRSTRDVVYPRCAGNETVTVPPDGYASSTVHCDTGIR